MFKGSHDDYLFLLNEHLRFSLSYPLNLWCLGVGATLPDPTGVDGSIIVALNAMDAINRDSDNNLFIIIRI